MNHDASSTAIADENHFLYCFHFSFAKGIIIYERVKIATNNCCL
ncbi:hypothetical protein HMP0721_1669 [Pseudoramibacter alactolyticus ATCC 23263]|uniref:Uncharacterized protein n=1 Tax=Pseudoramibacter alactolyticus ATCC 23263 TaxID=887929 RepID=E6MHW4_9FIRM|nr:hypothetical protein HMP0721_1669 [Pseudoramibacter alactolyticus ATCC 23263]